MTKTFDAVLFDLLTALLDSWSLWNWAAGDPARGRAWRERYLELTYGAQQYRPYPQIVAEAAEEVGLSRAVATTLLDSWDRLEPWPEAPVVLEALRDYPLGVVTNCSVELASRAARCVGFPFEVLITAEQAGRWKPDPRPYELALEALEIAPDRVLFVAGSPYDVLGAARVGMPVVWHNRVGLMDENASGQALEVCSTLTPLISRLGATVD